MQAPQIAIAVLLAGAVLYTIFGWNRQYGALSGRSRLFRTVGLVVLDLLLTLALLFAFVDFGTGRAAVARQAFYVLSCVILVLVLLFISALDALETITAARREQRDFVQKALAEEMERARQRAAARAAERNDPSAG